MLLTSQSNRFIDNSTNNFTITTTGTPKTQAFQPFPPTAPYVGAWYGGSGYFNGTTDYLDAGSNNAFVLGSGDWTVESWVNPTSTNVGHWIFLQGNASGFAAIRVGCQSSQVFLLISTNGSTWTIQSGLVSTVPINSWSHIAVTRSGTTVTLYVNGTSVYTSTALSTSSLMTGTYNLVGRIDPTNLQYFTGQISNLRLVKGTAVYTGAFTPPTLAPLTTAGSTSAASYSSTTNINTSFASSATSLLLNFTNAGIYDASVQNNGITVSSAQVSTTQYQWSPTSMKFNGTTDYLSMVTNPALNLGTGSFTVEAWINLSAMSSDYFVISASGTGGAFFGFQGSTNIGYGRNAVAWDYTVASGMSPGVWYHIAWCRSSTSMRIFVNGTQVGTTQTTSQAYDLTTTSTNVANQGFYYLNGYIQDLRITNGIARYTANFTPPTTAFPTQ